MDAQPHRLPTEVRVARPSAQRRDRPATDGRPPGARRPSGRARDGAGDAAGRRDPGRLGPAARRVVPARRRRRIQRRQERVHQCAPRQQGPRRGRHPDHGTDSPHPLRRDDSERTAGLRHPCCHGTRRLPQGHPHCRHAGHQRDHPRARAPDDRVRAARGFRAVRDLRRPALHRIGARVRRSDPSLGQEGGGRRQQDRHLRARWRARRSSDVCRRRSRTGARHETESLSGQRAPREPRKAGRAGAVGGQPLRGARALHPRLARRAEPVPAQAVEPARGRRRVGAPLSSASRKSGWRSWPPTRLPSTTSSGSWRSIAPT